MKVPVHVTRAAMVAFVALAVLANLPQVERAVRSVTGNGAGLRLIGALGGLVFLALAVFIWVMAIRHLEGNALLKRRSRAIWRIVVYGTFVFGGIAYHLRFLRHSE
jgi:hypothetical protein